jgi:hypothetical protein
VSQEIQETSGDSQVASRSKVKEVWWWLLYESVAVLRATMPGAEPSHPQVMSGSDIYDCSVTSFLLFPARHKIILAVAICTVYNSAATSLARQPCLKPCLACSR